VRHHGEEKEEEEEMFYSGDEHVDEKEGPILGALRPHCESTAQCTQMRTSFTLSAE
jgi:hypothetical protein